MLNALNRFRRWLDRLNVLVSCIAASGIVFACSVITWAVIGRGLFGMNTIWELEASVYLLIYAAFLGLAYSDRAGSQVAIGMLRERLTGSAKRIHRIVLDAIALALFSLLFWSSLEMFLNAWYTGWRSISLWGPPLWVPYLAMPIGSAIMMVNLVLDILIRLYGHEVPADNVQGEH
ncbi:TRAP transporter small permease [Halomonas sp. MCCC 1A11036]|uniref:TRAP transporter small permease protein n=1 Tax=Billgrantia zhangzhouensis TaxID=2733481 RepID=A0ABS9AK11_9GAMM|nr:TRAP transporter small permease [Halomonas zhangzhouensis]MCE8022082.1 TRAP transporter small permease [Halomonas zhangzhouensis]